MDPPEIRTIKTTTLRPSNDHYIPPFVATSNNMSCPTYRTLHALPTEVLESILPHLSQPDLTICVRVSRAWNKALLPYLWRTLAIRSHPERRQLVTDEALKALRKNGSFVRELKIAHKQLYDQFLPARQILISDTGVIHIEVFSIGFFSNLDSLELLSHDPRNPETELKDEILALVRQNPHLRRLKIDINMDPSTVKSIITKYLPVLQDLDLGAPWRGDVGALLQNLPECIRAVRLRKYIVHVARRNDKGKTSVESGISTTIAHHHHALESLYIHGPLGGHEEKILIPFLKSCSRNLKSVGGMACFIANGRIASALSDIGFTWKELSRQSLPRSISDADAAKVISYSSSWTNIDLYTPQVGPLTAAAIVENCERLEALELSSGASGLTGSPLQAVLSKATRLRSLQAHWLLNTDKLTAMNILSSQWATTSLEHVDFKIDVPRADGALADNSTAIQASRSVQRQVLQRLGQQKKLRKLIIGGMATTLATGQFGHQRDCLEMTLESGLDELVDLKDLELLDIHHMDHRAGVPELEWMTANLPKLQMVNGMLNTLRPPSDEVREWLTTHQPTWR
ncbi:hypothetical protein BG003_007400 [Podila horticola]|nr:hypothetical protein BG003_007400 [Podila horticola]